MDIVEIPSWLEGLPLAPEYRPTDTEFADPIAYISKIEKEASAFGICKIIPPILKPSRKYVFYNLNKSLAKCPELGPDVDVSSICSTSDGGRGGELKGFFTTRQQELGQSVRKSRGGGDDHGHGLAFGVNKQVWQSGEVYTLERFELKSKAFAKSVLAGVRDVSPLAVEALFWKAANEEPIYVEYANDVPGSAFGEPGSTSRYFHRRRRRKDYSNGMKNEMESTVRNCNDIVANDVVGEHGDASIMPLSSPVDGDLLHSRNKSSSTCREMEGTAGWKLSNSPWNLQVIARSPGSLTRFMPDDIPGVTSPMVYIGMLFSWFAWHVEDHELHSMNFLHTGSQKTWYAVPGDYAFSFEEVLRMKGYGGDIDHLAALKSLGEKTTLLSPEILLASGLPCCRLIQNPGEFVVTFPRAYHVGFSHGFNCGEAANFGTPQWLNIAKEAAVRRAAMSYLPMLSHQQLLYLLSMSFILRVPRSLLPGARSSRLRNRHKLERELLVKKAFIDDILNENHLLSNLLRRGSGYHSVLWHPDLLPSLYKEPLGPTGAASTSREDETENNIEKENTQCDFSSGTGLYVQPPNALYEDDDDDLCDFQINSGTLPCVACGILGYPFMCVVQPSERASTELLPTDSPVNNEVPEISVHKPLAHQLENTEDAPSGSDICTFSKDLTVPSVTNFANCWNTSNRYLRPRIFCLEHALQVEELLLPRGGANMLIICHSDYLKMKAHAMTVAEEIGRPFKYNEVSLPSASREELNLIDLSIEDEEHYNCGEDWTAKLGINLRYCLKVNNESPSKHVNNALALAVTRNPTKFSSEERDANSGRSSEGIVERKGDEMIKYSRKKHRINYDSSEVANRYPGFLASNMLKRSLSAVHRDCNKEELCLLVRNGSFQVQHESQIAENTNARGEDSHNVKILVHSGRQSNTMPDGDAPMIEVCDGDSGKVGVHAAVRSSNVQIDEVAEKFCIENEDHDSVTWKVQQKTENVQSSYDGEVISGTNSVPKFCISVPLTCNVAQEKENTESEGNLYEPDNNCVCAPVSSALSSGLLSEASSEVHLSTGMGLNVESKDETHMVNGCNEEKLPIGDVTQKNQIAMDMVNSQVPSEDHKLSENVQAISERNGENTSICDEFMNQPASASMGQFSDVRLENRTIENLDNDIEVCSQDEKEVERREHSPLDSRSNEVKERKRKKVEQKTINKVECNGYVRSPCEGLRPRTRKVSSQVDIHKINESLPSASKKARKSCASSDHHSETEEHAKRIYRCDLEGCRMICKTKSELQLHRNNRCTVKGCGKRFNSHKYAMRHQRVHDDERPLKCPWEGCSMSFKWAWARTEHIRVHTGERPYLCKFEGCGRSFRFVSDFSRHRRKSGHYVNPSSG